ncbi:unnamed protein product [Paramecium sonneborni]|uniref:Transmembrane protein n=1 Tax=Paramecium sonneborni TaxID=65129 RepID=A0A8S1RUN9_9CILI|nr:unnamed protein product [Paramecium sonneborni]
MKYYLKVIHLNEYKNSFIGSSKIIIKTIQLTVLEHQLDVLKIMYLTGLIILKVKLKLFNIMMISFLFILIKHYYIQKTIWVCDKKHHLFYHFQVQQFKSQKSHIISSKYWRIQSHQFKLKKISYESDIKTLMQHVDEWMDGQKIIIKLKMKRKVNKVLIQSLKQILQLMMKVFHLLNFFLKIIVQDQKQFNINHFKIPPQNDSQILKRLIQKNTIDDAIMIFNKYQKLEEQLKILIQTYTINQKHYIKLRFIKTYQKTLYANIKKII